MKKDEDPNVWEHDKFEDIEKSGCASEVIFTCVFLIKPQEKVHKKIRDSPNYRK